MDSTKKLNRSEEGMPVDKGRYQRLVGKLIYLSHTRSDIAYSSKDKDILIVCLYVDDLIFTRSNPSMFGEFKEAMTKEFKMIDIGLMTYYLGIEVNQREDRIFISQAGYAREILKKFKMDNNKPINTPVECGVKISKYDEGEKVDPTFIKSWVRSLRYLTCTRPDILYAVGLVSRYMKNPTTTCLKIAKRILRYIKVEISRGGDEGYIRNGVSA
ncbi:hypothetical protein ZIOFF_057635 [Zingiber officinale]|uniref:Reverse transcriptase Ty1/copia-type domain-containing protein n=1 Tax=Zingiber officinale TaxID=94328 RepID=A0A8J5F3M5_ZINOF|nr:hypothetical protein ZIOFF_057635 [Zingiber officinale]